MSYEHFIHSPNSANVLYGILRPRVLRATAARWLSIISAKHSGLATNFVLTMFVSLVCGYIAIFLPPSWQPWWLAASVSVVVFLGQGLPLVLQALNREIRNSARTFPRDPAKIYRKETPEEIIQFQHFLENNLASPTAASIYRNDYQLSGKTVRSVARQGVLLSLFALLYAALQLPLVLAVLGHVLVWIAVYNTAIELRQAWKEARMQAVRSVLLQVMRIVRKSEKYGGSRSRNSVDRIRQALMAASILGGARLPAKDDPS